jgi:hypothetical protein
MKEHLTTFCTGGSHAVLMGATGPALSGTTSWQTGGNSYRLRRWPTNDSGLN